MPEHGREAGRPASRVPKGKLISCDLAVLFCRPQILATWPVVGRRSVSIDLRINHAAA